MWGMHVDHWMLPWEAAEPLRVVTSPSAPHAISACIYLIHLCSCWAWSRMWLHCSASASWRDILMDLSCQREDEHCLGARKEIETSENIANPWRTLPVLLVDLTSRNAGCAKGWSRTELSGSEESLFSASFELGWLGELAFLFLCPYCKSLPIPVCPTQGTSNWFFSAWDQIILHFLQGLMCSNLKYLQGLCWSTSPFIVLNSATGVRCSVYQFL